MFGWKKKRNDSKMTLDDVMSKLRPDLSRESLGVGPDFPGVTPNPLMSSDARKRNAELRTGRLRSAFSSTGGRSTAIHAWS